MGLLSANVITVKSIVKVLISALSRSCLDGFVMILTLAEPFRRDSYTQSKVILQQFLLYDA